MPEGLEEIFSEHSPLPYIAARSEVCCQGRPATHVFLLEAGVVALTFTGQDGREFIVDFCGPGTILGVEAAVLEKCWPVSVVTCQRCRVRMLPNSHFVEKIKKDTGPLGWHMLITHSHQAYRHIERMASLALLNTRQRVEEFFSKLAVDSTGMDGKVRMPLSQEELARYVQTTRQHLNKVLREIEDDGLIRRANGCYFVDRARLWHQAGPDSTAGRPCDVTLSHADDRLAETMRRSELP
jgi:CRP/FNR family transcriptional regulator